MSWRDLAFASQASRKLAGFGRVYELRDPGAGCCVTDGQRTPSGSAQQPPSSRVVAAASLQEPSLRSPCKTLLPVLRELKHTACTKSEELHSLQPGRSPGGMVNSRAPRRRRRRPPPAAAPHPGPREPPPWPARRSRWAEGTPQMSQGVWEDGTEQELCAAASLVIPPAHPHSRNSCS